MSIGVDIDLLRRAREALRLFTAKRAVVNVAGLPRPLSYFGGSGALSK